MGPRRELTCFCIEVRKASLNDHMVSLSGHGDAQVSSVSIRSWDLGIGGLKGKGSSRHGFVCLAFLNLKPTFSMVLNIQKSPFFGTMAFQAWTKLSSGKVES